MIFSKKHYIFLQGGLGNQLYMAAYADFLSKQGYKNIKLITRTPQKNQGDTKDKKKRLLLTSIPQKLGIKVLFLWHRYLLSFLVRIPHWPLYRQLWCKILKVHHEPLEQWLVFNPNIEPSAWFNLHIGYFQSYKYISKTFLQKVSKVISEIAPHSRTFNIQANDVAVHIRRGDFLSDANQAIFSKIELPHYLKGLALIAEKKTIGNVYIFSDDFHAIENDIKEIAKYYQVIPVKEQSVLDDINTLQHFTNYVIGNSTFSWWGAMLSNANNKIVVAPKKIVEFKVENPTPFPEEWTLLD